MKIELLTKLLMEDVVIKKNVTKVKNEDVVNLCLTEIDSELSSLEKNNEKQYSKIQRLFNQLLSNQLSKNDSELKQKIENFLTSGHSIDTSLNPLALYYICDQSGRFITEPDMVGSFFSGINEDEAAYFIKEDAEKFVAWAKECFKSNNFAIRNNEELIQVVSDNYKANLINLDDIKYVHEVYSYKHYNSYETIENNGVKTYVITNISGETLRIEI